MPSVNLTTVLTAAAQFLHVLDSGESLSSQQISDGLLYTNDLLDSWSSDPLMALSVYRSVQSLTQQVQVYTIGTGQTWNITRPMEIEAAALINSAGPGARIEVVNAAKWASIPDRQAQSNLVRYLFYDRGYADGDCYVSPVPLGSTLSIELLMWNALTEFADTVTTISIDPGYLRMLKLAVAVEMAPQYDVSASQNLTANLMEARNVVRGLNATLLGRDDPQSQGIASPTGGSPPVPAQQAAQ